MAENLTYELKSDLQNMYKIAGDMLNMLEKKNLVCENRDVRESIEEVKAELMDISGTLQKDIFNCDYLITKFDTKEHLSQDVLIGENKGDNT
jgi:hypothetical protein